MIAVGGFSSWPRFLESRADCSRMADQSEGIFYAVPNLQLYTSLGKRRHNGRMNLTYCDGHIERFKTERILDSKSPKIRCLWNNDNQPHTELK
jgi:prepilin-type processing-associated H-X9-DG protein